MKEGKEETERRGCKRREESTDQPIVASPLIQYYHFLSDSLLRPSSLLVIYYLIDLLFDLVSMRNAGDLAGQLSRSYLPSLSGADTNTGTDTGADMGAYGSSTGKGERKSYGYGRFSFPQHYSSDGHNGIIGNYDDDNNDGDDDDDDDDDDDEGDAGGDSDCHGILSLIATQIFEQKQKEREKAVEMSFLMRMEEERREAEKERERIQALAVSEMEEELRAEVEYEQEQERERERVRDRDREMTNEAKSSNSRSRDRRGEQGTEQGTEEGEEEVDEEESPQHFWDSLLRKPLFGSTADSRSRSRSRIPADDSADSLKRFAGK